MTVQEARQVLKGYGHLCKEYRELEQIYKSYVKSVWRDDEAYKKEAHRRQHYCAEAAAKSQKEFEMIERTLIRIPPLERRILRLHFLQGQTWRKVAFEVRFSEEYVKGYLQRKALQAFAAAWPKEK